MCDTLKLNAVIDARGATFNSIGGQQRNFYNVGIQYVPVYFTVRYWYTPRYSLVSSRALMAVIPALKGLSKTYQITQNIYLVEVHGTLIHHAALATFPPLLCGTM